MGKSKSRVICIRLSQDDSDERGLLDWIEKYEAQGYDLKQILIPALLSKAGLEPVNPAYIAQQTRELLVSIDELRDVVSALKNSGTLSIRPAEAKQQAAAITNEINEDDPMMQALKARARPGRRTDA